MVKVSCELPFGSAFDPDPVSRCPDDEVLDGDEAPLVGPGRAGPGGLQERAAACIVVGHGRLLLWLVRRLRLRGGPWHVNGGR